MKQRILLIVALIPLAGCVDTADSLSREYRNANNEHIDALMMVTNETTARRMTVRVLKPMTARYEDKDSGLDSKWDKLEKGWGNKPNTDVIKEVISSDNLHLYRSELKVNAQRMSLELARLRNLLAQTLERERELAQARGADPNDVKAEEVCPALKDIVTKESLLRALRTQLEKPKIEQSLNQFFAGRLDDKLLKIFRDKEAQFKPKKEFALVD